MRTLIILLAALAATGLAWAEGDAEGKGILDFSTPPNELYPARLVGLDGKNIDLGPTRTSYWVEPGDHEITVTALIDDSMQVPTRPQAMPRGVRRRSALSARSESRYSARLVNIR